MSMTGHDILLNADLFRAAYPCWPHAEPETPAMPTNYDHDPDGRPPTLPGLPGPVRCLCGYPASSGQDLDDHIEAASRINDGQHHGEARR